MRDMSTLLVMISVMDEGRKVFILYLMKATYFRGVMKTIVNDLIRIMAHVA